MGVAFILCGLSFVLLIAARSVLLGRSAAWLFLRVACRLQPTETSLGGRPPAMRRAAWPPIVEINRARRSMLAAARLIEASVPTSTFRSADWPRPAGVPTIRHGAASD